jgi:hypothetical protein
MLGVLDKNLLLFQVFNSFLKIDNCEGNVYYGIGGLSGNNYGILQIMYHNPGEAEAIDNSGIVNM